MGEPVFYHINITVEQLKIPVKLLAIKPPQLVHMTGMVSTHIAQTF